MLNNKPCNLIPTHFPTTLPFMGLYTCWPSAKSPWSNTKITFLGQNYLKCNTITKHNIQVYILCIPQLMTTIMRTQLQENNPLDTTSLTIKPLHYYDLCNSPQNVLPATKTQQKNPSQRPWQWSKEEAWLRRAYWKGFGLALVPRVPAILGFQQNITHTHTHKSCLLYLGTYPYI